MSSFDEFDAFEGASLSARAMAARPMPYLDELNPAQREAVERLDGPVLMLAGAGTGKTKALTARIVHLLNTQRARPNEILAVTFTNKAAREMKDRVGRMLGGSIEGVPWLGTFHAICVKLLRRHAELVDLKSNFTILDTDDQIRQMRKHLEHYNVDQKKWPARYLVGVIDSWKNKARSPATVSNSEDIELGVLWSDVEMRNAIQTGEKLSPYKDYISFIRVAKEYQKSLHQLNAVDFGDLLLHVVTIFQNNPDILAQYQRWFRYILVDEYQDTNVAQYLWLRLLAQGHQNICCVGDDDQSIYGWRGAEIQNILKFEKDFPGALVIRLEQNYRSTEHILKVASKVISSNKKRWEKELWTSAEEEGQKVKLIGHWDGDEEARWIGEKIDDHHSGRSEEAKNRFNPRLTNFTQELDRRAKAGLGPISEHEFVRQAFETGEVYRNLKTNNLVRKLLTDDRRAENMLKSVSAFNVQKFDLDEIAIMVRASHQMRAFEDRFLTIGLPYRVIGGPRFYERLEIRDAMAYFRVVVSPDDDLAFERIVNTPKRGLGNVAQQKIQNCARENGVSLVEGARILLADKGIGGKGAKELQILVDNIARWRGQLTTQLVEVASDDDVLEEPTPQLMEVEGEVSHIELAEVILDESGYTTMWQNDKTPEAPGRLENLKELVKALESFENLQGFLEHVSLIMDNEADEGEQKVTIMTLHAAKGLEFPAVFLPGWEDGLFPSQRSMDESGLKGLEEERRLAYVGITRAEELCTISFAGNRRVYGQWQSQMPSRFIDELPEEHVEVLTPPGLYGGGFGAAASVGVGQSGIEERVAKANTYNSPGWKRMQSRAGQHGLSQPKESRQSAIDATAISSFTVGDRVFHQKFGYGEIAGIEGDKLTVEFEKAGTKNVVASYVTAPDDIPF